MHTTKKNLFNTEEWNQLKNLGKWGKPFDKWNSLTDDTEQLLKTTLSVTGTPWTLGFFQQELNTLVPFNDVFFEPRNRWKSQIQTKQKQNRCNGQTWDALQTMDRGASVKPNLFFFFFFFLMRTPKLTFTQVSRAHGAGDQLRPTRPEWRPAESLYWTSLKGTPALQLGEYNWVQRHKPVQKQRLMKSVSKNIVLYFTTSFGWPVITFAQILFWECFLVRFT